MATNTTTTTTSGDCYSIPNVCTTGGAFTIPTHQNIKISGYGSPNNLIIGEDMSDSLKKLENRIVQLEMENSEQKKKIADIEHNKLYNRNGTAKDWYDLVAMLNNMHSAAIYYGGHIIIGDNFPDCKYGFVNLTDGSIWEIGITIVKYTPEQMYIKNGKAILIPDAFNSLEGKNLLLDVINGK